MQAVNNSSIRVALLASQLTCWGLEHLLQSRAPQLELAGSAMNLDELQNLCAWAEPHVLVLESEGCPAESLLEALAQLAPLRVVMLTNCRDEIILDKAIVSGVRGIVRSQDAPQVLLKAIEKVHSGELWIDRSATARIFMELVRRKADDADDPEMARIRTLTARERETIQAVTREAAAPGKVIARHMCISDHTLRNHLSSIYSKLGLNNRLDLYAFATRHRLDRSDPGGAY